MIVEALCPCGSKRVFDKCCGRFLSGEQKAKTPGQLMRSRYSAHALGGYGHYLVTTWLTAVELGLTADSFEDHSVNWQKLEVLKASQRGNHGLVEFKAYFYPNNIPVDSQAQLEVHHEHSVFKRIDGVWYYLEARAS